MIRNDTRSNETIQDDKDNTRLFEIFCGNDCNLRNRPQNVEISGNQEEKINKVTTMTTSMNKEVQRGPTWLDLAKMSYCLYA